MFIPIKCQMSSSKIGHPSKCLPQTLHYPITLPTTTLAKWEDISNSNIHLNNSSIPLNSTLHNNILHNKNTHNSNTHSKSTRHRNRTPSRWWWKNDLIILKKLRKIKILIKVGKEIEGVGWKVGTVPFLALHIFLIRYSVQRYFRLAEVSYDAETSSCASMEESHTLPKVLPYTYSSQCSILTSVIYDIYPLVRLIFAVVVVEVGFRFLLFPLVPSAWEWASTWKFRVHFCRWGKSDITDWNAANDRCKPSRRDVRRGWRQVFQQFPCKYDIGIFNPSVSIIKFERISIKKNDKNFIYILHLFSLPRIKY